MNSITITTIVVVALLTIVLIGLTILSYKSCLKTYRLEVNRGIHDKQIKKEYKNKKKGGLLGLIGSYVALSLIVCLFVGGIVYKASGNNFIFNNHTALVIKSGSMSNFYDETIANKLNNDKSLQFDVGDICIFEKINSEDTLEVGQVYGYKHNNIIITHRLVDISDNYYKFRGDNNNTFDGNVSRENIVYHYTGNKIPGIGAIILYAQSYFGIYSLIGVIGVLIGSEVVYYKVDKINKNRFIDISPGTCISIKKEKDNYETIK